MTRRSALTGLAALGAAGMAATGSRASSLATGLGRGGAPIAPEYLGWDERAGEYTLPDLPYAYDALSDVIDEQTMRIHHDKHHAGYVKGANTALKNLESIRLNSGDASTLEHWQRELSFNMGGHINHTLFWKGMKPTSEGGGGQPSGNLINMINRDFGSFSNFSDHFTSAATTVEGSGWGWLVYEPIAGRLMVLQMHNQHQMLFAGAIPLLGVDVWEHAYYLKYQNNRGEYVKAFMQVVDWDEISRRLEAARG
ncbi:MAG: superoxide dismutase [Phycisphaerales bacterium]